MDDPSHQKNNGTALDEYDRIPENIKRNVELFHEFLEAEKVAPGALKHQLATLFWRMQLDARLQELVSTGQYGKAKEHLDTHTMPMPKMGIHVKLDALGYMVKDAGDMLILIASNNASEASIMLPEDPLGSARLAIDLAAYVIIEKHVGSAHAPQPLYNKGSRVVRFNTWATSQGELDLTELFSDYVDYCQNGVVVGADQFTEYDKLRPHCAKAGPDRYVESNTTMIDTESELQLPKGARIKIHAGDDDDMVSAKELKAIAELALRAKTDLLITTDKRISSRMQTRLEEAGFESGTGGYFSVISDRKGRFMDKLVPGPEDASLVAKIITFIEENGHSPLTAGENVEAKSHGKAWRPKSPCEFINPLRPASTILVPNDRLYNNAPAMSSWFITQCALLFAVRPGAYPIPKEAADAYDDAKNGKDTIPSWAHRALDQALRKLRSARLHGDATKTYERALEIFAQLTQKPNEALLCYITPRRRGWNPRWHKNTFLTEDMLSDDTYESMRSGIIVIESANPIHRRGGPLPLDRRIKTETMPVSMPVEIPMGDFKTGLSPAGMAIGYTNKGCPRVADDPADDTAYVANTERLQDFIEERNGK